MACFLVPVVEAVAVTAITVAVQKKETKIEPVKIDGIEHRFDDEMKVPFSRKLKWLSNLLWGGSTLLCFEHVWHGEVVPWFPFLTAASDPAETAVMLNEMVSVGSAMALLLTVVWCVILLVTKSMEKKALKTQPSAN